MVGTRELNYIFDFSKTTGENIDNVIIKTTLKEIDFGVLRKNTSDLLKKKKTNQDQLLLNLLDVISGMNFSTVKNVLKTKLSALLKVSPEKSGKIVYFKRNFWFS